MTTFSDYMSPAGGGFSDLGILGSAILAGAYPGTNIGETLMQAHQQMNQQRAYRMQEQRQARQDQLVEQQLQQEQQHRAAMASYGQQLGDLAGLKTMPSGIGDIIRQMASSGDPALIEQANSLYATIASRPPQQPTSFGNGYILQPGANMPEPIPGYADQQAAMAGAEAKARAQAEARYGYHAPQAPSEIDRKIATFQKLSGRNPTTDELRQMLGMATPGQQPPAGYAPVAQMPGVLGGTGSSGGLAPIRGGPADPAIIRAQEEARNAAKPSSAESETLVVNGKVQTFIKGSPEWRAAVATPGTVRVSVVSPNLEGVNATTKEEQDFRDLEVSVKNTLDLTSRVRQQISQGATGGFTPAIMEAVHGIAEQVKQTARQMGVADKVDFSTDNPAYARAWGRLGGVVAQNQALKSNLIDLAYAAAATHNRSGNIATKDVAYELERLGASYGDPVAMSAALDEIDAGAVRSIQNRALVIGAKIQEGVLPKKGSVAAPASGAQEDPLGIR